MKVRWKMIGVVCVTTMVAFASSAPIETVLDFIAPTVVDVSNINGNQDGGTIVYDAADGLFKGKNWNNSWQVLSPTASVASVESVTTATTLTAVNDVVLADATSSSLVLDLFSTVGATGKIIIIKKTDASANGVTITPDGSETIDGDSSYKLLAQNESVTMVSDGSNWHIIEKVLPYQVVETANDGDDPYTITAGQWGDLSSQTLPPGTWKICGQTNLIVNAGTSTATILNTGISTTSGNSATGLQRGDNRLAIGIEAADGSATSIRICDIVTITSSTTYYLKAWVDVSITNLYIGWKMTSRRLD